MAHFVKVNADKTVGDIIVVHDAVLLDGDNVEREALGVEFIVSLGLDGVWVRCSYNGSTRVNYPSRGFTYHEKFDAFIPPQPYPSWVLDEATCLWVAPVAYPTDGKMYAWDETITDWVEVQDETP